MNRNKSSGSTKRKNYKIGCKNTTHLQGYSSEESQLNEVTDLNLNFEYGRINLNRNSGSYI